MHGLHVTVRCVVIILLHKKTSEKQYIASQKVWKIYLYEFN